MFEKFQNFIQSLGGDEKTELTRNDPRVAAAALFFHVIDADGVSEPAERVKLGELLKKQYTLDKADLQKLLEAGKRAEDESVDFYASTSILKRALDGEQRVAFVELMWELVYADGVRHELEDNVVWRVAELLGVSDRDRVSMRQRAAERAGTGDEG